MRIIRLVAALVILDTVFSSSSDLELQIDGFNPFTIVITLSLTFCYKHKVQVGCL